jgi:hypothetical protein
MQMVEIQAARYQFFRLVYERSNGDTRHRLFLAEIGRDLWLTLTQATQIAEFLQHEGLIEWAGTGGGLTITHEGIKQVEQAEQLPSRPTRCFPSLNSLRNYRRRDAETASLEQYAGMLPFRPSAEQSAMIRQLVERIVMAAAPLSQNERRDFHADAAAMIGQLDKIEPTWLVISTALRSIRDALALQVGGGRGDLMSSIDWVTHWDGPASPSEAKGTDIFHLEFPLKFVANQEGTFRARISGGWLIADRISPTGEVRASDVRFVSDQVQPQMERETLGGPGGV